MLKIGLIGLSSRSAPTRRLVLSQAGGQLCLVAAIPVLTRFVPIEAMGTYALAVGFALILQPIATARAEYLLPVAGGYAEMSRILRRAWLTVPLVALAALATVFVVGHWVGSLDRSDLALSTSLSVVAYSVTQVSAGSLIRRQAAGQLSGRNLWSGVIGAGSQVGLVLLWPSAFAMAAGLMAGRVAVLLMFRTDGRHPLPPASGNLLQRTGNARAIVAGVLGAASAQAVVIASGMAYGARVAAEVGMAQRVVGTPTVLAGQGLRQWTMLDITQLLREMKPVGPLLRSRVTQLGVVSTLMAVVVAVVAPVAMGPVLGDEWSRAGQMIAILAVPLSLQLTYMPLEPLLMLTGQERTLIVVQIVRLGAIAAVVTGAAGADLPAPAMVAGLSVIWTLTYVVLLVSMARYCVRHDAALARRDGA